MQLGIPRHDRSDNAYRLAQHHAHRLIESHWGNRAGHRIGEAGIEIEHLGYVPRLPCRLAEELTRIGRLHVPEMLRGGRDTIGNASKRHAALARRHATPRAVLECVMRSLNRGIHVFRRRRGECGPRLLAIWIDRGNAAATARRAPAISDEQLVRLSIIHRSRCKI